MSATIEGQTAAGPAERIKSEGPIGLAEAGRLIPAKNPKGHASVGTMLRWILSGKRGHKLEAARIGGEWRTSLAAVRRFRERTGL